MSLFDAFKKINEALSKSQSTPPAPPSKDQDTTNQTDKSKALPKQRYKRIVRWLKENYGDQFEEGTPTDEIEKRLSKIFKDVVEPNYISQPEYVKGWKKYIEQRQYGDLVRVE